MIFGVGLDLEDLADFGRTLAQSGEPFLKRVFTEQEIEYCEAQPHSHQSYAVRYCAKEAAMKALGIAGERGLKWRDFEVVLAPTGVPGLVLRGNAAVKAKALGVRRVLLSLTHSKTSAGAVAIAETSRRTTGRQISRPSRKTPGAGR